MILVRGFTRTVRPLVISFVRYMLVVSWQTVAHAAGVADPDPAIHNYLYMCMKKNRSISANFLVELVIFVNRNSWIPCTEMN
jgi:hypothetical protein